MKKFVALFLLLSTSACAQAQDESRAPSLGTQHQSAHSAQWFKVEPGGDTTCAQGTPYHFWTKGGTSDKLLVYFLGGGACWSSYTCSEDHPYYEDGEGPSNPPRIMGGIFDFQNPENPFLDWNVVYIPYCTGDTHWGNNVHTYPDTLLADEVKIHHKGFVNAMAAVRWAFDRFVQPSRVFLAGDSAGAYGSILFAPYLMEHYAQSQFVHLGDSGAGVGTPSFVQSIIEAWKPLENIHPMQRDAIDWATNSPETFTLTEFYKSAAKLFPQHRFVQFNTAQDKAQRFFYKSVGGQPEDWRSQMQANMSNLDQHLSNFRYYVGWGEHHVALLSEVFYRHQVNGTRLRNFVDDLANGRDVASVQCSDCASEELYDIGNPVAGGDGNQPYQDPAFRVIPQDSNQCGPASLYTVFHYLRGENVYQGTDCNQTIDLSVQLSKVTSESEFGQWVNGGSNTGTSWQQMKYALKDLRLDCSRVFAVELQAQTTERDTAAAIEERTRRLQDIHARYLTQKRPVVLHLRRKPLISGHYVVLIGYEPAQGVVYVADPNKGKIDVVPTDEFLTQSWYRSPTNRADDNVAYWDGEWLGFYPTDPEAAAVHDPPVEWVLDRHGIQKALIVSGDDYGLTPDVNQGVVGGLQDGLLTSASIQPSAPHAASAMDIAAQTPGKGYGVHLTLTRPAWASIGPVSDRSEVRSLVGANGLFPTSVWAVLAWAKSADVERELRAQIESVLARGVYVDHLDCHDGWCNMMDRRLDAIFLRLAKEYQLPVRWGSAAGERLLQHNLAAPSNLILPNTNDQLSDYERRKRTVIGQIRKTQRGEISELVLHPQQGDVQHNQAFRVLDSTLMMDDELRQTLVAEGIELVDYGILEEIQERMGQ